MKKIYQLPPHIIAKIAAGEVIERPAYAVKELIENAIDAHATYITIQVEHAGLKSITVTDNGEGMSREDLSECFKPHTTSKISEEDQLLGIQTLGFRGEALSSIAAVSSLVIKSRTREEHSGTVIHLQDGSLKKMSPVGIPVGTSIRVENLFYNMPARKKFLKSTRTEFRHIIDCVMQYSLAFPKIRFFLTHDRKILFDFPGEQKRHQRIEQLLGTPVYHQLIPVLYEDTYIQVSGYVSKPSLTTQSTHKHFVFVNNRKVSDKLISLAVKEAYGSLLDATSYPVFVLFLTLPFEMVDVNVHPRKDQVSFQDGQFIFDHIERAITKTLSAYNLTFHAVSFAHDAPLSESNRPRFGNTQSYAGKLLKNTVVPWEVKTTIIHSENSIQIHKVYIGIQTKQGFLFIDQHAAHERILYEQFSKAWQKNSEKKEFYHLPRPLPWEVSVSDAEVIKEQREQLHSLGFGIEHFRDTTFLIRTVPLLLQDRDIAKIMQEIIDNLQTMKKTGQPDKQTGKMIAYLACRAAIKAGDVLTKDQMRKLVDELEKTPNNSTCPHGRPTKIEMRKEELDRMFRRI